MVNFSPTTHFSSDLMQLQSNEIIKIVKFSLTGITSSPIDNRVEIAENWWENLKMPGKLKIE